jgi:MtN3 and saliva related transmembrane protein
MNIPLDTIGYIAAFFTTGSFVPQALHTFKTRDVSGISLGMYSAFVVGIALWLVYGLLLPNWPMVIANVVTLSLSGAILWMKLRYHDSAADDPTG